MLFAAPARWYGLFAASARGPEPDGDRRAVARLGKVQTALRQFSISRIPVADVCFLRTESGGHAESTLPVPRERGLPQRRGGQDQRSDAGGELARGECQPSRARDLQLSIELQPLWLMFVRTLCF